jgi:hypothetical protein
MELLKLWSDYVKGAISVPFERGTGDCCAFAAGWASLICGEEVKLPALTDESAKDYLERKGGMEAAVASILKPLGFEKTNLRRQEDYAIACAKSTVSYFPECVGIMNRGYFATRKDSRTGLTWMRRSMIEIGSVWTHPKISKTWA